MPNRPPPERGGVREYDSGFSAGFGLGVWVGIGAAVLVFLAYMVAS